MSRSSRPLFASTTAAQIPRLAWWLPLILLGISAPLWLHWFEPASFVWINTLCAPVAAQVWTGLSILGNGWGLLALTSPLLVLAPRLMLAWLCAAPFAIAFARGGKFFIVSPRPAAMVDNAQMRIIGETLHNVSMPSGHTLTAFAVASGIYFAIPQQLRARYWWLWLLAAGAGLSRIAVGAHWPGDVAVGACLGMLAGMLGNLLLARVGPAALAPSSWGMRGVAALLVLAIYHLLTEEMDFPENLPFQHFLAGVTLLSLLAFVRQNLWKKW